MLSSHFSLYSLALLSILSSANAIASPRPPQSGRTIELNRRSREPWTDEDFHNYIQGVHEKYHMKGGKFTKRSSGTNLLTNLQFDSSYFGSIAVGTPPVSYNVILDTGSADLWLATTESAGKGADIKVYDASSSSTFKQLNTPFSITYGSGSAKGQLGSDNVQWAGFEVVGQIFGLVTTTSAGLLTPPLSGLMGLAHQSIAASGATPLWQTLAQTSGTLDSPLMAFQLTRFANDTSARNLEPGGTVTIGATDSSLYTGDIDYQSIPSGSPGYWIQSVTGLTVNGQTINLPSGNSAWAAIDTGTTGIGAPASVLTQIYAQVPNSAPGTGQFQGYYTIPCSTTATVSFSFGGSSISWPIASPDFILEQVNAQQCIGAFFEVDNTGAGNITPSWIVGDSFLKNVYSVFRQEPASVGFANLSAKSLAMSGTDGTVPSPTIAAFPSSVSATGSVIIATGTSSSNSGASTIARTAGCGWILCVMASVFAGVVL